MLGQSELPGAAWYPDPYGASTLRWWDGVQWTDAVHPPVGAPAAPAAAPTAEGAAAPAGAAAPQQGAEGAAQAVSAPASPSAFPYLSQMDSQPQQLAPVVSEVVTAPTTAVPPSNPAAPAAPVASAVPAPAAGAIPPPTFTNPPPAPAASEAAPVPAQVSIPGPVSAAAASTAAAPAAHVAPPATPLGLRAAAATLDEDTGTGGYEWSRESRAFDTFPGSAMPVSISPRSAVTADVVTNTASSWTIVFMPLFAVVGIVAVMLVIASVPALRASGFPSEVLLASVAVAFYLVTVLFALADNRRLYSNGVDRPPHWAWSLLTAPIYLVARVVAVKRETGRTALGQLIVHVMLLGGGVFLALNFTEVVWPYLVSLMAAL